METVSKAALAVLLLTLIAGCGDDDDSKGAKPSPSPSTCSPAPSPSDYPFPDTPSPSASTPSTTPSSPRPTSPRPTTPKPTTPKPTTTQPQPGVPSKLAGKDWESIPTSRKVVALTFDGGADDSGVPSILKTLRDQGVKATFFLTGQFTSGCSGSASTIAAAGHRLGNHSTTHPYFTKLSDAQIRQELSTAASRITSTTGKDPRPLFRFPYGDRDTRTIRTVNAAGYVPVRWTVDTLGWKGTSGGVTADTVVDRVVSTAHSGQIVLMHVGANPDDGTTLDAQALPRVISELRGRGYGFVTLDALTG
ncbi:polysaccharide deacetylase family protein [Actinocorallia sp. B10E7]|uniref:polysaccharide deacetylase family protein n=1 Tax=Actinocorallia sp. B10E7 TaxID=3153558 RepID=UPI00325D7073